MTVRFKREGILAKGILQGTQYVYQRVDADPCVYCGGASDSDEHVTPRKLGGGRLNNIVRACQGCNRERGATPLLRFLLERSRRDGQSVHSTTSTACS